MSSGEYIGKINYDENAVNLIVTPDASRLEALESTLDVARQLSAEGLNATDDLEHIWFYSTNPESDGHDAATIKPFNPDFFNGAFLRELKGYLKLFDGPYLIISDQKICGQLERILSGDEQEKPNFVLHKIVKNTN